MKKCLSVFAAVLIFSLLMVSMVDARILRNEEIKDDSLFLTIFNLDQVGMPEAVCEAVYVGNSGCSVTQVHNRIIDDSSERMVVYFTNCEYNNGCYCDYYLSDENLFGLNGCDEVLDRQISNGWCDEGEYGENFCDEGKYIEHNGCEYTNNPNKDSLCIDDGDLITDPNQPEIKSGFSKFFLNIWGWITSLFGGN